MKKLKDIWKENKAKIMIVGSGVVGSVVVVITTAVLLHQKGSVKIPNGAKCISWVPTKYDGTMMNLERVKDILEANKDNSSMFAIFREGPNPNEYVTILLDNTVIIP